MTFGFLLASGPEQPDGPTVLRLARAALDRGHDVRIFLMKEGVEHVRNAPGNPSAGELAGLIAAGAEVSVCALNSRRRRLGKADAIPGVVFGSQYDHARIVAASDRYLAFA
jgi:sulfur relay (sulfurtransferase) complex TusBCD TusD component (DsrE family)